MHQINDPWLDLPPKIVRENRWTLWKLGKQMTRKGRPVIELMQGAFPERPASVEDPYTWTSFNQAHAALQQGNGTFRGLAYINSRFTPIVTITFYNAIVGGRIAPWAMRYFDMLNAYAEEGIVPGSLMMLYEGRTEKPLTWGNVSVRSNPFIAFTGKRLPGAPSRVGTSPTRLESFMAESRRDFERLIQRRGNDPKAHLMGKNLERLLSSLKGVRKLGPGHWVALSPVGGSIEPNLTIRLDGERILLFDHSGTPTQEVIKALGLGYADLYVDETPPELHLNASEALVRPLEGELLLRVQRSQQNLRQLGRLPQAFENCGFTYQEALEAGLGAASPEEGVVVYSDLEGRPLSAQLFRPDGQVYSLTPGFPATVWLGPGLSQAQEGVLVVEGLLDAVLVWSLVRQDGLGVIGLPDLRCNIPAHLPKRLALQPVYLQVKTPEGRENNLERWGAPFHAEGFPVIPLEALTGEGVDLTAFVQAHGGMALLERLVGMGVGA